MRKINCLIAALAVLAISPSAALAAPGDVINVAEPANPAGIAADSINDVIWAIDAKPSTPKVVAIDQSGNKAGEVAFVADLTDVQALSWRQGLLYVADLGDAAKQRASVQIVRLEGLTFGGTAQVNTWDLVYPDGARDARAFAMSPRGNIYVVTFGAPGEIYRAAAPGAVDTTVELTKVADAPNWVTDAVFVDGERLAVRTFNSVQILDAATDSFQPIAAAELLADQAGEGLTIAADGTLWLSAAKRLIQAAVPTSLASVPPAPSASPAASTSASPRPSSVRTAMQTQQGPQSDQARGPSSATTKLAATVAAGLAILAGIYVFFEPRRAKPASAFLKRRSDS